MTTIALPVLCTGELKIVSICILWIWNPLAHIAFEIWSSQREKHWQQGIFIIVRFFQESLSDATQFIYYTQLSFDKNKTKKKDF